MRADRLSSLVFFFDPSDNCCNIAITLIDGFLSEIADYVSHDGQLGLWAIF